MKLNDNIKNIKLGHRKNVIDLFHTVYRHERVISVSEMVADALLNIQGINSIPFEVNGDEVRVTNGWSITYIPVP